MKRVAILLAALAAVPGFDSPAPAAGVDELPIEARVRLYDRTRIDPNLPTGPSVYRDWKSKKPPPWTFAFVGSTRFGSWSDTALKKARDELAPKWSDLGLSKAFVAPPAAGDDVEASRRIRELADAGVDAILVCCASSTGLNDAIKYAHGKGALTVPLFGFSTSPYALNATTNFTWEGEELVDRVADELGDKGNLLTVGGFLGPEASQALDGGIKARLARRPGMKLVGDLVVDGGADAARAATEAWLKSHHDPVDAIIVRPGADFGILDAFVVAGRKAPLMSIGGDLISLCYWRHNLEIGHRAMVGWPPAEETAFAWNVAMRTLQGQGPKTQSILADAITLNSFIVRTQIDEDCRPDADGWFPIGDEIWGDSQTLDSFFLRPADPTRYKP